MVVTMALRWAIYGTWMGYLWHLELVNLMVARDLGTRNVTLYFFWTRIIRITRMFFGTRISQISRILCSWCLNTRFFLNTNFTNKTNVFWHTDLTDLTDLEPSARCEWQLVTVIGSLWLLTRCGYWLVVVIDSLWLLARCGYWLIVVIGLLWLLTRCGYWLVVVIDSLWLLTCYVLNDKSKKISVSHAKHWQIREICEIRVRNKYIRAIRSSCERTAANKDLWDPCA